MTDLTVEVSIIICTRNRPESLLKLLVSLSEQLQRSPGVAEVVVVDNSSDLKTLEILERFKPQLSFPLKYVTESVANLSRSRNLGVSQSFGRILSFLDDDCIPRPGWLTETLTPFSVIACDAAGGRVISSLLDSFSSHFLVRNLDLFWGLLAHYDLGGTSRKYEKGMAPFIGANMSVKADCFRTLGMFRTDIGHGSGALGEDSEYFNRLMSAGKTCWYNSAAVVDHFVPSYRLTLRYFIRWHVLKARYLMRARNDPAVSMVDDNQSILKVLGAILYRSIEVLRRLFRKRN